MDEQDVRFTSDNLMDVCQLLFRGGIGLTGFWAMLAVPILTPIWWVLLAVTGGGAVALGRQVMDMVDFDFQPRQREMVEDDGSDNTEE